MVWFRCQRHHVNPALSEQRLDAHDQVWNHPDASNRAQGIGSRATGISPASLWLLSASETMPISTIPAAASAGCASLNVHSLCFRSGLSNRWISGTPKLGWRRSKHSIDLVRLMLISRLCIKQWREGAGLFSLLWGRLPASWKTAGCGRRVSWVCTLLSTLWPWQNFEIHDLQCPCVANHTFSPRL